MNSWAVYPEYDKNGQRDVNYIPKEQRLKEVAAVGFPQRLRPEEPVGFPPVAEKPPDPREVLASSINGNIRTWLQDIPVNQSPPLLLPSEDEADKEARIKFDTSFQLGTSSVNSSFIRSSESEQLFVRRFKEDVKQGSADTRERLSTTEGDATPSRRKVECAKETPQSPKLFVLDKSQKESRQQDVLAEIPTFKSRYFDEGEEMEKSSSVLSLEAVELGSDDNKFEASEIIEYKDHSWILAVPIDREKTEDKNVFKHLVYSYQAGIDRINLTTAQAAEMGNTVMIKYRRSPEKGVEVVPIYSALPSTGLMSLKYRHNKGIEMRLYGIVNFVDFIKDHNHLRHRSVVWTDALGPLYLTSADRSNIRRKLMGTEEKIFAPLRMCMITVKGDFTLNAPNGFVPKWQITSYQPLIEEASKDPNIGRNLWPARVIRFDDLITTRSQNGEFWLKSNSNPDVHVLAGSHLTGIIMSAGLKYAQTGVMQGFVVPFFMKNSFAYYEALIVGPPRVVMILTEGRFLNYCPKTWPPHIEAIRARYRTAQEVKERREEPRWPAPRKPADELKSIGGAHEIDQDLRTLCGSYNF